MQLMFILILIFAVLVAIFAIQNAYPVTIYFLKWQFEASLGLVILICLLIGAVSLGSLGLIHQTKAKLKTRTHGKERAKTDEAREAERTGELPVEAKTGASREQLEAGAGATGERDTMNAPGGVEDSTQEVES